MTDERIEKAVKKVKEAVEFFKKRNSYIDGVDDLVSLAESYLTAGKEWPEKVNDNSPCSECKAGESNCSVDCEIYDEYLKNIGKNEMNDQCRLVATRLLAEKDAEIERLRELGSVEKIEEVVANTSTTMRLGHCSLSQEIATSINAMIFGKEK